MQETLEFIPNEERQKKIKELINAGCHWRCLGCGRIYKERRQEHYDDGHGGHFIDMCVCGSDLFKKLEDIRCLDVKVKPADGVLVLKEHHAKYCECAVGEIWTGDAETECHAECDFELLEDLPDKGMKIFRCPKSGLKIVILKSTEEELKKPDELGSTYFRLVDYTSRAGH